MIRHTRRQFLQQSAALGSAVALPLLVPRSAFGAGDTVRIAVAGINGRGQSHISEYLDKPNCKITALVDPDSRLFAKRVPNIEKKQGLAPKCYQDIRKALESSDIDAVSVATTNHWHSLITIWACQAGKDVYVEKPCSHNLFEGHQAVEAARKYNRIVQHGTQSRASQSFANIAAAVQQGKYGKLLAAKAYCCKPRWTIGFKPIATPPAELDFDIWLGPAPKQPYHENLVHYNWHWFWDTGNGDSGNQGVHQYDIARWVIGKDWPTSVVTMGGRWVNENNYQDQGQTPNMELSVFDFDGVPLIFETRGLVAKKRDGKDQFPAKVQNEFYLEAGAIIGNKFFPKGQEKGKGEAIVDAGGTVHGKNHFGNFVECVRSRKQDELNADILQGHRSSALCHLGNISYRMGEGQTAAFDQWPKNFPQNVWVEESLAAIKENLAGALNMNLSKASYQIGPKLVFDGKTEQFVGNAAANVLLTRKPRPPFAVPETV